MHGSVSCCSSETLYYKIINHSKHIGTMRKYLLIGLLLTAGLLLSLCEASNGSFWATVCVKLAGVVCLGVVSLMTRKEEDAL